MNVSKHIKLLGLRAQDKVTGFTGVVTSVAFDLYGCVTALLNPGMDKDSKLADQTWFDVGRLKILNQNPVMEPPNFVTGPQAEGRQGAAEKPKPTTA
jgi:hypothetical protein